MHVFSCGKILKDEAAVQVIVCVYMMANLFSCLQQVHAARTKHQNFSESTEEVKPLTEEEKKAQLAR